MVRWSCDGTMSSRPQMALPSSSEELEALIRQVVREEFVALVAAARVPGREDESTGVSLNREDAALLRDGLAILRADGDRPEVWMSWSEAEAELGRAEAEGAVEAFR